MTKEFRPYGHGRKRHSKGINSNASCQPNDEVSKDRATKKSHLAPYFEKVGSAEGIIIATIIASHMSRKLVADPNQLWPCIGIHIIDIVQPPGISISEHIERQK